MSYPERAARFISLEGGEGAGKTTQAARLAKQLTLRGIDVVATREPGGTELAERIRELLLDPTLKTMPPLSELLLMFAARASHLEQTIKPALDAGRWVICDRFVDASYAYQGAGRGLDTGMISTLEQMVIGPHVPDLTLLLDLSIEQGAARIANRSADRFEQERSAFFERVAAGYRTRAEACPERIQRIDATDSEDRVFDRIWRFVEPLTARPNSVPE